MNGISGPIISENMQCCYNQVNSKSLEETSDFNCIENKGPCIRQYQLLMSFSQDFCELLNNFPLVLGPRVSSPIPILTWQLSGSLSSSLVVSECPVVGYFTPTISSSLCRRVGTRSIECRGGTDCKALWLVIELVSREAGPRAAPPPITPTPPPPPPPASEVQGITVCLNTSSSECDLWLLLHMIQWILDWRKTHLMLAE